MPKRDARKPKQKTTKSKSQTATTHLHWCHHYIHLQALKQDPIYHRRLLTHTPARAVQTLKRAGAVVAPASTAVNQTTSPPEPHLTRVHPRAGARRQDITVLYYTIPRPRKLPNPLTGFNNPRRQRYWEPKSQPNSDYTRGRRGRTIPTHGRRPTTPYPHPPTSQPNPN